MKSKLHFKNKLYENKNYYNLHTFWIGNKNHLRIGGYKDTSDEVSGIDNWYLNNLPIEQHKEN